MTLRERAGPAALGIAAAVAGALYDPLAEAAEPKRAAGLVVAFVALALTLRRPRGRSRFHLAWWCAGGFVVWSAITTLWGAPSGLRDVETWVAALALGAAAASLGRDGAITAARWAGVLLGVAASLHAVVWFALGARGFGLHGGQGNPNWLGLLLAPCILLTLDAALAVRSGRPWILALCSVAALAEVVALILSHSRVAWCAAGVGLVVLLATRRAPTAAVALIALAVVTPRAARADPTEVTDVSAGDSLRGRLWIWEVSAEAALGAMPLGAGLGRFGHAYLEAQGDRLAKLPEPEAARRFVNATTAHNEPLQVLEESGPVALVSLVAAFALAVIALLRKDSGFRAGAAVLVAVAVCALGDSPVRQPAVVFVVALVFGALTPSRSGRPVLGYARLALAAACACALVPATRTWLATRERTLAYQGDPDARLSRLAKSARIDPASGEAALALGLARLESGDAEAAIKELVRARPLLADVGASVALGNAYFAHGESAKAEREYRRALGLDRGSFRAHADLAVALLQKGALEEAEEEARAAGRILPGHSSLPAIVERIHRASVDRVDTEVGDP